MKVTEEWLKKQMQTFDCTREQAIELWDYDQKVEHNEATEYDLTAEQEKEVQKIRKSLNRGPREKRSPAKRERKIDENKLVLIQLLSKALQENSIIVDEVKTETEINFTYQGENYALKLTKPRSEK